MVMMMVMMTHSDFCTSNTASFQYLIAFLFTHERHAVLSSTYHYTVAFISRLIIRHYCSNETESTSLFSIKQSLLLILRDLNCFVGDVVRGTPLSDKLEDEETRIATQVCSDALFWGKVLLFFFHKLFFCLRLSFYCPYFMKHL